MLSQYKNPGCKELVAALCRDKLCIILDEELFPASASNPALGVDTDGRK